MAELVIHDIRRATIRPNVRLTTDSGREFFVTSFTFVEDSTHRSLVTIHSDKPLKLEPIDE